MGEFGDLSRSRRVRPALLFDHFCNGKSQDGKLQTPEMAKLLAPKYAQCSRTLR